MTLQTLAIRASAESFELGIAGLLRLDGSAVLHRIEHGRIEIYCMVGATRRFLAELRQGSVLVSGGAGRLVALAPEGARLAQLPAESLAAGERVNLIESWLREMSEGVARFAPPRPDLDTLLEGAGAELTAGQAVTAGRGLLWLAPEVAATAADLHFLSLVPLEPGRPLPVTSATWITATGAVAVTAESSAGPIERDDWPVAIAAFHTVIGSVLHRHAERERDAENHRVALREDATLRNLVAANESLVGVLSARAPKVAEAADDIAYVLGKVSPKIKPRGATSDSLRAALEARGLRARTVDLSGAWWRADRDRLIGFLKDDGRPVALLPDWRGRYRIFLRGEKPRRIDARRAATLDPMGVAVAESLPDHAIGFGHIGLMALALCKAEFFTILLAGIAAALLGLLLPLAIGEVVDVFVPDRLAVGVVLLGIALAMLNVCSSLLQFCTDMARLRVDAKLSTATQIGVIDRVLRLPSRYLKAQSSADLTMRVMAIDQTRRLFTGPVLGAAISSLYGLSSFGLLFYYSPAAAAAAALFFAAFLAISAAFGFAQLRAITTGEALTVNLSSLTLQIVQNVSMLRAFGAERRAFSLWAKNTAAMRSRMLRARLTSIGFDTFLACYDGIALAAVFAFLGYAAQGDRLSTGAYLAFVATYQGFLASTEGLGRAVVQIMGARPMMRRGDLLLAELPETTKAAIDPGELRGEVEVSGMSFAYERDAPLVLNQVSIRAEPGKFIAIAGPSGCGKSTLLNLVLGFERPSAGAVLYDGRDVSTLDLAAVRRQIGIVRQNGKMLGGSVFENILGMHDGTIDDAWDAAELAGIAEDIRSLPMGLHTVLNEGVPTFSGGQIQRLLLARALVGRPKILLLDEATSALDNVTQAEVSANIERLGVTRIVIAHRLSTIRNADRIYFLDRGRVAEAGTFAELMRRDGLFAAFASRQNL